jgi:RNA polymerase sigma-70 factor, ECF subfamily
MGSKQLSSAGNFIDGDCHPGQETLPGLSVNGRMDRETRRNFDTEPMRELARLWMQSQSAISAYLTANVIDAHHAEDLVQEVAQVVAEKFAEYDRSRSFTSWTLGIARNRLLKYYRTRSRDRLVLSEAALLQLASALERVEYESEDRRIALRKCLERVEGRRRRVLEMRYGANARVGEIAQELGMSTDGVSVMLHRIRSVLFDCIRKQLAKSEAM